MQTPEQVEILLTQSLTLTLHLQSPLLATLAEVGANDTNGQHRENQTRDPPGSDQHKQPTTVNTRTQPHTGLEPHVWETTVSAGR